MPLTLDLLRHGVTAGQGRFCGRTELPLLAEGWTQLAQAVEPMAPWDAVISSPRERCLAFARQLAKRQGLALVVEPDLAELDFGHWENLSPAELMTFDAAGLERFWNDPYGFTPPAGEPLADFRRRVLNSLARLLVTYPKQQLLVITHAGIMRLLLAEARRLPREGLLQISICHAQRIRLAVSQDPSGLQLQELACPRC